MRARPHSLSRLIVGACPTDCPVCHQHGQAHILQLSQHSRFLDFTIILRVCNNVINFPNNSLLHSFYDAMTSETVSVSRNEDAFFTTYVPLALTTVNVTACATSLCANPQSPHSSSAASTPDEQPPLSVQAYAAWRMEATLASR